jgi:uncharacterized membrane protein YqaE (UPF0057 family)
LLEIAFRGWKCVSFQVREAVMLEAYLKENDMRLIIALVLPWLTFFTIGRPIAGIICLILQITLIGWLPATIWAVYALSQFKTDQKIERALRQRA